MITQLNLLVRSLSRRSRLLRRFFEISTDYCWLSVLGFWEFDLHQSPKNDDEQTEIPAIRWYFADVEDCRRWSRSGVDGFSENNCQLLASLIEKGDRVLVGQLPTGMRREIYGEISGYPDDLPDCYAACAVDWKPMTKRIVFCMEEGEGIIRTVYTRQACRRRGIARRLYGKWVEIVSREGFKRLYVDIDTSNTSSIYAAEQAGAHRLSSERFYVFRFFKSSFGLASGSFRSRFVRS